MCKQNENYKYPTKVSLSLSHTHTYRRVLLDSKNLAADSTVRVRSRQDLHVVSIIEHIGLLTNGIL